MYLNSVVQRGRKAILLVSLGLFAYGLYCCTQLPVAIFPDLNAPRIIVTAGVGDMPTPTVLATVTLPLENALSSVPGVRRLGSLTVRGSDELDVSFAWGTDMVSALQLVNAKISAIQQSLPTGVMVSAECLNPSVFPIMGYSLYSNSVSPENLRRLATYTIRPRLLEVPGVQQITVMGGDSPEYLVRVAPSALKARGLSILAVETAIAKANEVSNVGYFDGGYQRHDILVDGLFKSVADLAAVTIAIKSAVPVTVGQVATVERTVEPRTVEVSGDGHDAVLLDIIKQPAGNTVQIAEGVVAALKELHGDIPLTVTLSNYYDQSQIVRESQASVSEAILVGGALALCVLMLFLGNLRASIMVLIILPLTIVMTFILMRVFGQTLNIMTLGALAIALGLVIDDGIVVVENIFHQLEIGKSRANAISDGLQAITPAMIGSSITTMAAFLPLAFLVDLTGQFFAPLAIVMIMTLGISLVLALALIPLVATFLLPTHAHPAKFISNIKSSSKHKVANGLLYPAHLLERLSNRYGSFLQSCFRRRPIVALVLILVVLFAGLAVVHLKTGFFPEFDEGGFVLDYQLPDGTSLAQSSAVARGIEMTLASTPEVAAWSRRTGTQLGFDITSQNVGDMSIRLSSMRSRNIDQVIDDVRAKVNGQYPEAQAEFHQILQDNIGDIAGSPSPVEVKIYGPDQSVLEQLAQKVDTIVSNVPGVVDDFDGVVHSDPQTVVGVDSEAAQRFGLTTDDVSSAASADLQGDEPTHIQQGEQQIGVRVVLNHLDGQVNAASIANLPIASPITGQTVPLSQVATIREEPGAPQITREDQRQMIAVTADLSGRDLGSATRALQKSIAGGVTLPPGYSIEYGGLFASQQQSFAELTTVLVTAALMVFTLLVVQFRSVRQAVAVIIAAILSLCGVFFALYLTATPLNISSFTGAIMIVGIVTENGIVLFDFFNQLSAVSPDEDPAVLMGQAGEQRLRPILMTTVGAILALLPLAMGVGAGSALQKPLAIAVIGGLCISVFFTLIVAPVLYLTSVRKN
jgi:CzcA family heavy metal efflux pump